MKGLNQHAKQIGFFSAGDGKSWEHCNQENIMTAFHLAALGLSCIIQYLSLGSVGLVASKHVGS